MAVLGLPQTGQAAPIVIPPVVAVVLGPTVSADEALVNSVIAQLNPLLASLGTDLTTLENGLLGDVDLSPAVVSALVAVALIEAGGTLPATCSVIASLEANIPTSVLGIPLSIAELLGLTGIESQLIATYVDNEVYQEDQAVLSALTPAELALLQVNYNTTYYPPGGGAPIARTEVGYIGLPSLLNVDAVPGDLMCADTSIDIGSLTSLINPSDLLSKTSINATLAALESLNPASITSSALSSILSVASLSLSSLKIDQQISKLPLSATTMPLVLNAVLPNLGSIGLGYNTQGSSAPQGYSTTVTVGSNPLLAMSDTTSNPGPSLEQTVSLGSTLSIDNTWSPVPAAMTTGLNVGSNTAGVALTFPNTVSSPSDWSFNLPLNGLGISANANELVPGTSASSTSMTIGAGLDVGYSGGGAISNSFSANVNLGTDGYTIGVSPLPKSFDSCSFLDAITCSNVNSALNLTGASGSPTAPQTAALSSMHFTASSVATTTQALLDTAVPTVTALSTASGPTTGGTAVTVTGTNFGPNPGGTNIYFGAKPAGNVACSSTTSCTANAPAGTLGSVVPVTATSDGLTSATAGAPTFTYSAPTSPPPTPVSYPTPGPACGADLAQQYAQITGTHIYSDYYVNTASGSYGNGSTWLDTGGTPVSGCSAGLLGEASVYPAGMTAGGSTPAGRLGSFTSWGGAASSLTKTGTITCPTGTDMYNQTMKDLTVLLTSGQPADNTNWLCPTAPVNTKLPVITPSSPIYIGNNLSTTTGTWTPTDMATTTSYQWYRCTTTCTAIAGATTSTYTPSTNSIAASSDAGKTLEVVVTQANSDGTTSATSAQTATVTLPAAPTFSAPPVVSSTGSDALSTTTGTVTSPVPVTYSYQWQACTTPAACTNIAGATASTLSLAAGDDQGDLIQVIVTAKNVGGTTFDQSNQFTVVDIPAISGVPTISDTTAPAIVDTAGIPVSQGDKLAANNGSWTPTSGVTYSYQWQTCSASATPSSCSNSTGTGATTGTYTPVDADVSEYLQVVVTATDFSGSASATSAETGQVQPNSLAFQPPQSVVDGTVKATASDGSGNTYIGGSFDTIGPGIGQAGAIPPTSTTGKTVQEDAHATGGTVLAIAADGTGGYFIGGTFTSVQGIPCAGLAYIPVSGVLNTTFCNTGIVGQVRALDYFGGLLAVGGSFYDGSLSNLVFFDSSGNVHASGADPNGPVNAIANDAAYLYVGGAFTSLATSPTATSVSDLAKYSVTSGPPITVALVTTWPAEVLNCATAGSTEANCVSTGTPAVVDSLAVLKNVNTTTTAINMAYEVLVGGSFNTADASASGANVRDNAAAFFSGTVCATTVTSSTPAPTAVQLASPLSCTPGTAATVGGWVPNPNGPVLTIAATAPLGSNTVLYANEQSAPVYLGGLFTTIALTSTTTENVSGLAEFAIAGNGANGSAPATAAAPTGPTSGTQNGDKVQWQLTPGALAPSVSWIPMLLTATGGPATVSALTIGSNGNVYAGGNFTSVNGSTYHRIQQFVPSSSATSAASVANTSWDPDAGNTVDALAQDALGDLFVGGQFLVLGGTTYNNVAEMAPNGVVVPTWNPGVNGPVGALAAAGGVVYVGGLFTSAAQATRSNLAAITTGGAVVSGFNPAPNGVVNALTAANSTVYVGGAFSSIGGASRNGLAAIDPMSGTAIATWTPSLPSGASVSAIAANSSDVYVGGSFITGSNVDAVEFNSMSAATTSWNPGIASGAGVNAIVLSAANSVSPAVYVGGTFASPEGNNLIAVDQIVGAAMAGWSATAGGPVNALAVSSDGSTLFAGGSFTSIGGAARSNLAGIFTATGGATTLNPAPNGAVNAESLTTTGGVDTLAIGGAMQLIAGDISGGFGIF
ncbi:MAG TPA: IPT/TIG domain-containing protein [Acidimicrobiales bacterium]